MLSLEWYNLLLQQVGRSSTFLLVRMAAIRQLHGVILVGFRSKITETLTSDLETSRFQRFQDLALAEACWLPSPQE